MKRLALILASTVAASASIHAAEAGELGDLAKKLSPIFMPITIGPEIVGDVLKGENLEDSVTARVHRHLDAHKEAAQALADVHGKALREIRETTREIGGDELGDVVDFGLEGEERASRHAAGAIGAGAEIAKGRGLISIPAEALAAELRLAESNLLPEAQPLPAHVKERLGAVYPATVLEHARFVVGHKPTTNVAEILNFCRRLQGVSNAVTVGRVILFESEPGTNYDWWAHELGHVQQYMEMGFDGFAREYVKNRPGIEADADRRAGLGS